MKEFLLKLDQAFQSLPPETMALLIVVALWNLIWKGFALYRAARLSQKGWFAAILIINTCSILEIIYFFLIAKPAEGSTRHSQ